jgi:hypothetical protein
LTLESLLHVLGSDDTLVDIHQDDINGPPQPGEMIDSPEACRQNDEDQEAIAELQLLF